ERYGYVHDGRPLEIVAARVEVIGRAAASLPASTRAPARIASSPNMAPAYVGDKRRDVPLFYHADLAAGDWIAGPALVVHDLFTTVIEPGWEAEVLSGGELLIAAASTADEPFDCGLKSNADDSADPVFLEVFNNLLATIAEQMGVTLRNTASSVNI